MLDAPIEVSGLRKRLGPTVAPEGTTFIVQPGQVTGFVGPQGDGTATVRFQNTIVAGALDGNCAYVLVSPDNADGTSLYSTRMGDDTAAINDH